MKSFIHFDVVDSQDIHLWLDCCHPLGGLYKYEHHVIYSRHETWNELHDKKGVME